MSSFSESERHGLEAITANDSNILSIGISTGGAAEIEIARRFPNASITATTIDEEGVRYATEMIAKAGLTDHIEVKYEDVSQPLPYADKSIDYIYARLVLHYLTKQKLEETVKELHRVLRSGGRLYVVVRSTLCPDANLPDNTYDSETGLTTYRNLSAKGMVTAKARYFHDVDSITGHLKRLFTIEYATQYDEKLFKDFARTIPSGTADNLIEVMAKKGNDW